MNLNDSIDQKIKKIITIGKKYSANSIQHRGFIDLAGIFIDYDNKIIANYLKTELRDDERIIYFSNNDTAFVYDEHLRIEHTKHNKNYYYYDQCHTIGSDLKQPNEGHIVIIINRYTKYTNFAQALFRFRKLNRGTFMSILFVKEPEDAFSPSTNNDVYTFLNENEQIFNNNQLDGIKYQSMKAIVRNRSRNYAEIDLEPEYKKDSYFDKPALITRMKKNINNLNDSISGGIVKTLYDYLNGLEIISLKKLVIGSGNEKVTEQMLEVLLEADKIAEGTKENDLYKEIPNLTNIQRKIIKHLNCNQCRLENSVKLFNTYNIQINNKQIYISLNLLNLENPRKTPKINVELFEDKSRLCFVEFNDIILIELEIIGFEYYINRLPVYDFNGDLMNSYFFKINNRLDIDEIFVKIFNFDYKNIKDIIILPKIIKESIDNMSEYAKYILYYYNYNSLNNSRYNISKFLIDYWLENEDEIQSKTYTDENSLEYRDWVIYFHPTLNNHAKPITYDLGRPYFETEHNLIETNNIFNVNLNFNTDRIILTKDGFNESVNYRNTSFAYGNYYIDLSTPETVRVNDTNNLTKYISSKIMELFYCTNHINNTNDENVKIDYYKLKSNINKLIRLL